MPSYTAEYYKCFNYGIDDFVPCELTGSRAVDIHHIEPRSQRKDLENDIYNLIALTRQAHEYFGDKKQFKEFLKEAHQSFMQTKKPYINVNPKHPIFQEYLKSFVKRKTF